MTFSYAKAHKLFFVARFLGAVIFCLSFLSPTFAAGKPEARKVYLLTSTYGVLVGTLTGIASLAFYDEPGEHKKNIAIGASLGLYTGVLLGTYVLFLAPDPNAKKETPAPDPDAEDEEAKFESLPGIQENVYPLAAAQELRWLPIAGWDPHKKTFELGIVYKF
jgi:hypothetical protein